MSLRYKFHHLFFGGKIQKKRLYNVLEDFDERIDALEEEYSDDSGSGSG